MSVRTAAIVIDDFLSNDQWEYIQNNIQNYLHSDSLEVKDDLYLKVIFWIKDKLKSFDFWNEHWNHTIDMWSNMTSLPSGIDRELNDGYHSEFGGFVYYIHPSWNSEWGGHLKFKNCSLDKIEPTPNRFVWINPVVLHGIEVVNENADHNRITVVGWPEGCVEYDDASIIINTPIEL